MAALIQREVGTQNKVRWGAVFAGMVVVLVTQLVLTVLGVSFGAGSINPLSEANPVQGLGTGAGVWLAVTSLLSLFVGGWVAGRLAANTDKVDSMLHGVVTWGVATLLSFFLITTTVGRVISGTAGVLGDALGLAGEGVKAAAPEVAKAVGATDLDLSSIKEEARKVLIQTRTPELQPKNLERRAKNVAESAKQSAENSAKNPESAESELDALLDKVFAQGKTVVEAADKEAIVNVLVSRTDMSKAQATSTVDQWANTLAAAREKASQLAQQAEQKTREVADKAAHGISSAAMWAFFALLLGFAAAAVGGFLGRARVRAAEMEVLIA